MKSITKDSEEENTKTSDIKTWKNTVKCPHIASIVLITLVAVGTLRPMDKYDNFLGISNFVLPKEEQIVNKNGPIPGCDFFSGKWIYDNLSYPLYKEEHCSFLDSKFPACKKNGRKDFKYQNWRWQPHHCDIPRFNSSALLEKLRGKKVIFVGDSLGRNQWESLICLITSPFPPSSLNSWKMHSEGGGFINYRSNEYNVTIGFYWSPFLVESNGDGQRNHVPHNCTVRIKSIENHGRRWIDGHSRFRFFRLVGGRSVVHDLGAFNSILNTWSDWVEMQINPKKTRMFFTSHSPFHYGPHVPKNLHCISKKEPISDQKYWPSSVKRDLMEIVESIIEKLEQRGVKVEYLNITQLSGYRVDAHPGLINNHSSDCLHWCLPGVPDVWNQILYAYIMKS